MEVTLYKSKLNGSINAIPSKSYAHRYLIASMLSKKECHIHNIYLSEDVKATIQCLLNFNCKFKINENTLLIQSQDNKISEPIFDCNESGSTLRFLIPIALCFFDKATFIGSERLIERGIQIYEEIFQSQGIQVTKNKNSITFIGRLKAQKYEIQGNVSSQYITGLLFALPLLKEDSIISIIPPLESKEYIDITMDVLKKFHIEINNKGNEYYIKGNQKYQPCDNFVEPDFSNIAFMDAFNFFNENNITIRNLNFDSLQGDKIYRKHMETLKEKNAIIDLANCIDLGPILMVFAALNHGATFINTSRLKIKESNRGQVICEQLKKVNVESIIEDNKIIIKKSRLLAPKEKFDSNNDHRIAMALALLFSKFDIKISNAEAINKSYPDFFKDLEKLGAKVSYDK